jgi:hypothetical protein
MTKIAGSGTESGSGFISQTQRHGSADPDPYPPQNVMDPLQHCFLEYLSVTCCVGDVGCLLAAPGP